MPMVLGSDLPLGVQQRLLGIYVHRYTKEHVPQWARKKRPDGTSYMPQFASDADWLRHTKFKVTKAGVLDARSHYCESSPTWPDGSEYRSPRSNPVSRSEKYPELDRLVMRIALHVEKMINTEAPKIKSSMPYKQQWVLEELIKVLQAAV